MKRIAFLLLAVVLMLGVAGCSSSDDDSNDNPLLGTWTTTMGADRRGDPDVTVTITFKEDNTFTSTENGIASDSGTWSTEGNVLTLFFRERNETETVTYSVDGNKLTMIASDGTLVWTRV